MIELIEFESANRGGCQSLDKGICTDRHGDDGHAQKVKVGDAAELLEQVLRQEGENRVFGGHNAVGLRLPFDRFGAGDGAFSGPADLDVQRVANGAHTIPLKR